MLPSDPRSWVRCKIWRDIHGTIVLTSPYARDNFEALSRTGLRDLEWTDGKWHAHGDDRIFRKAVNLLAYRFTGKLLIVVDEPADAEPTLSPSTTWRRLSCTTGANYRRTEYIK